MWALSGIAFGVATRAVGGFATNQFRLWAAWPVLAVMTWIAFGALWPAGMDSERGWLLIWSGIVGLVIGDIGYFHALATIGPRLASVIMCSWPITAVLCGPVAGDPWQLGAMPGVLVTVFGVALVLWCARGSSTWNPDMTARQWWGGIGGAVVASVGQAIGILLSRRAMAETVELPAGLDPLPSTLVRLSAAIVGIQIFAALRRRSFAGLAVTRHLRALLGGLLGTLFGPVLGVWLSMVAVRRATDIGTASALMAVTPLFMLPLAWFAYRSRIGFGALVGTLISVAGAAWLVAS